MEKNEEYGFEIPSKKVLWYYMLILNRYLLVHQICVFLLHIVPAAIVDTIAYISGREPMYVLYIYMQQKLRIMNYN